MPEVTKPAIFFSFCLAILAVNGNFLGTISNLWGTYGHYQPPPPPTAYEDGKGQDSSSSVMGKSFSQREGYFGGGDNYVSASQRGGGWGWGGWDNDHQNLDLYSLLGGLSFASLLGATIIYLARRNTSGRRRRSADGLSYLEDDDVDFSDDFHTKNLNIVELVDSFMDNPFIFSSKNNSIPDSGQSPNSYQIVLQNLFPKKKNDWSRITPYKLPTMHSYQSGKAS